MAEPVEKFYTFCIYIVAKIIKILLLIQKLHEDWHIEFNYVIEVIGDLVCNNPHLMKMAIRNGLDVNWLTRFDIPRNFVAIHKDLKSRGFLK